MFDRTDIFINPGPSRSYSETTITEKRAPTDDSIKLLNEMTEKALTNIVKRFSTTNNTFQASCALFHDRLAHQHVFLCKFTMNGNDHTMEIPVKDWDCGTRELLVEALYTAICNKVALEILRPMLTEMKGGLL